MTLAVPSVLVTTRSATGFTLSMSLTVAGEGSVVPVGGVAAKVLVTVPLAAVTFAVTVKLMLPPFGSVGTTTVPASRLAMLSWPAPAPAVGHTAPPLAVHAPRAVLVRPVAAGSLMVAPSASFGPLLVSVRV